MCWHSEGHRCTEGVPACRENTFFLFLIDASPVVEVMFHGKTIYLNLMFI